MAAKRVPGKAQPGRSIEAGAQWRRLAINIKAHAAIDREPVRHLPAILNVAAKIMSPAMPDGIIESGHHIHGKAKRKGLSRAQVCGLCGPVAGSPLARLNPTRCALHRGDGAKRDQRKKPIFEIKFIVEPQIVFHGVIRRTVGCTKLKCVRSPAPGNVIFKLVALLVRLVRDQ